MVQCGKCDHWVHAKCEDMSGLCGYDVCLFVVVMSARVHSSDEEYEILSDLPEDSVLFLCRLCRSASGEEPTWRTAVTDYKKDSFTKVRPSVLPECKYV